MLFVKCGQLHGANPAREGNSGSTEQLTSRNLCKPKFHWNLLLKYILSQLNPFHTLIPYLFNSRFNIYAPIWAWVFQVSFPSLIYISHRSHTCHTYITVDPICPSFPWTVTILLVLKSSDSSRKIRFGTSNFPRISQVIDMRHFWQFLRIFWLSHSGRKHLQEWDSIKQPRTGRNRKRRGRCVD
jgi:hypothetical protein